MLPPVITGGFFSVYKRWKLFYNKKRKHEKEDFPYGSPIQNERI